MSELDLFIEWLKTKDSAFIDTTDVPKVISWLEELKDLRLVMTGILGEMLQDRPDDFKLYNIKRMIEDYTVKGAGE